MFGGAGGGVEEGDVCWELRARLGKVTRIQAQEKARANSGWRVAGCCYCCRDALLLLFAVAALCWCSLTVFSVVVVSAIDSRVARFQSVPVGEVRWPGARVRCDVGVCCLSAFEAQATFGRSSPPSIM